MVVVLASNFIEGEINGSVGHCGYVNRLIVKLGNQRA